MRLTGVAGLAAAACLTTAGCSTIADFLGEEAVLDTGIEPVALAYDGPTYMALDGRTLVVRNGEDEQRLRGASAEGWLPDGNALVDVQPRRGRVAVVDPARGQVSPSHHFWDPSRAVSQVNTLNAPGLPRQLLRSYDLSLELLDEVELPGTDNPEATAYNELARDYYGAVPTIDGVTFAKWHDGSEWYEDGDYGVLRIEGDDQDNVLLNENIVGLYLSADGTGLLGLRQSSGEPCGGCVVDQDVVEIDPSTGEIGAEYGVPDTYDDSWRVAAMDKVGDRVAVRYYAAIQRGAKFTFEQRGTWVYDGEWTMVEGSEQELTWWQGEGRVVARVTDDEVRRGDGFDLFWIDGDGETALDLELGIRPFGVPTEGKVAGQLLPPPAAQ